MGSGIVDPQTFASLYVGWEDPGPDAIYQAEEITTQTLNTYAGALGVVQSQASDFSQEDSQLQNIEQCNSSTDEAASAIKRAVSINPIPIGPPGASGAVLRAIQCNTEAQLAVAQQIQLERQLLMTLITTEAVAHGQELNEKAQVRAADAVNFNLGEMP
jgi:hypothetical protein